MNNPITWHIFCRVIDNYGDIGVCWRLARQLSRYPDYQVSLWVDLLPSFQTISPGIDPLQDDQVCQVVRIRRWADPFPSGEIPGDVVIEAFGCALPMVYLAKMRTSRPTWINLEYLSAEAWVPDYHLKKSPVNGLQKTFFFPGFVPHTGGILLDTNPEHINADMNSGAGRAQFLQKLGIKTPVLAEDICISFFAYENHLLPTLLSALAGQSHSCHLLIPMDRSDNTLNQWLGEPLKRGASYRRQQLTLSGIPFTDQDGYDQLLAMADINFVRGEDSFVRTQVLGKPFIWHIYPQAEDAHLVKLEAFLSLYLADARTTLAEPLRQAHRQWNQAAVPDPTVWSQLLHLLPEWRLHAELWGRKLQVQGDLAANIVHFFTNQL